MRAGCAHTGEETEGVAGLGKRVRRIASAQGCAGRVRAANATPGAGSFPGYPRSRLAAVKHATDGTQS